ncbi:type II toxin-antitoxin system HicB family antitoxin [Pleurocapsa sp. PCC 7319]|uniref:type II toxin-antitoxin system HicB family antitoxin n=1 Tax=Pleurocapsa sp. PCC 7319 TaxID=118161 RepID=UPI00034CF46C|nr:type II toxin-antitoxin system HicB family antitoxin [Pleurocapsa sp. PCC 7319]
MFYPIVIHKDLDTAYGVTVPDLPGCFSAGDTMEEAVKNAVEAIECHVEGILIDNEDLPIPQNMEQHIYQPEYQGGTWALVEVDLSKLGGKTQRVNITLPERILSKVDRFTENTNQSRSAFLADAALEYINSHSSGKTAA